MKRGWIAAVQTKLLGVQSFPRLQEDRLGGVRGVEVCSDEWATAEVGLEGADGWGRGGSWRRRRGGRWQWVEGGLWGTQTDGWVGRGAHVYRSAGLQESEKPQGGAHKRRKDRLRMREKKTSGKKGGNKIRRTGASLRCKTVLLMRVHARVCGNDRANEGGKKGREGANCVKLGSKWRRVRWVGVQQQKRGERAKRWDWECSDGKGGDVCHSLFSFFC